MLDMVQVVNSFCSVVEERQPWEEISRVFGVERRCSVGAKFGGDPSLACWQIHVGDTVSSALPTLSGAAMYMPDKHVRSGLWMLGYRTAWLVN